MIRSSLSLLFSTLNNPSSLSLFLKICSLEHSLASLPFSGHVSAPQCLSCSEGSKTEHSTQGAASPVLSTGARPLPYSCWPHYSWYKPGCHWPSWPPGHTAGSYSASCWPTPHGPFPPGSFPDTLPQACSVARDCCKPVTLLYGPRMKKWVYVGWGLSSCRDAEVCTCLRSYFLALFIFH